MCIGCWIEEGSPRLATQKVIDAAQLIPAINAYGPLHIVIDDWNLEDEDILWCRDTYEERKSPQEMLICNMLLDMTLDERFSAMALADGAWEVADGK